MSILDAQPTDRSPRSDFPNYLKVTEVAAIARSNVKAIYAAIHRGELAATWIGQRIRIAEDDLREYLDRQRSGGGAS